MNDPHVEKLTYHVTHGDGVQYNNPPLLEWENGIFSVRAVDGEVVVTMKVHCVDEGLARSEVEPTLQAWQIYAGLEFGVGAFDLEFQHSKIIDRAPAPGQVVRVSEASVTACDGKVRIVRGFDHYPAPPTHFVMTPEVEAMYTLYALFRKGKARLSDVAYYCLTVVEREFCAEKKKCREQAARALNISTSVLTNISKLASNNRGGPKECRKWPGGTPYTNDEKRWLDTAVKALIRRVGEHAAGVPDLPQITMDLPLKP
ncbi:MAG: hypothetical protein HZA24_06145 [Nitrospirae bacterium]|nr:hypothetical protein [Nitrospirota bacterium]